MAEPRVEIESLHFSVGILGITGGALLLLVNDYAHASGNDLIPSTALGVLLLIIAALLAYSGVRRSLSHTPALCVSLSCHLCPVVWLRCDIHIGRGGGSEG
ncbi:hypothetical protein SKAU_G00373360 [Synaphobranchus kaupii]|uniref:Uncharacterized protein n=1 Tax=Synaphobranchus kaupii TaxID=118154 RepID=A0A9Q1IF83_SYNKA|nr:hypothetical protein SKAU_G00373360 [Synaphobranchus kaupii]